MPDDRVRIDPEFRPSKRGRDDGDGPDPRWLGVAAWVVAAIALGWLLGSPLSRAPEQPTSNTLAVPTTADTSTSSTAPRPLASPPVIGSSRADYSDLPLEKAVPGFVDTITTLTWDNQGVDILRWRPTQPAPETMISFDHNDGGWNRRVDASGRWFIEMRAESVLTVGSVSDPHTQLVGAEAVDDMGAVRRWSAVWHDTRPGRLAWLACHTDAPDSSIILRTTDLNAHDAEPKELPLVELTCGDPGVWLARWGDWGMLVHRVEGSGVSQVLLSAKGTEIAKGRLDPEGEWFVGVGPEGATVWTEGLRRRGASSFLLSPNGLQRRPVPALAQGERLESALVSPDDSLLALVPDLVANYGSMVRVVEAATGSVVVEIAEPASWVSGMAWSTDSRFLVYERWPDIPSNWAGVPQDVELVFYDTETNAVMALPFPGYAPVLRSGSQPARR